MGESLYEMMGVTRDSGSPDTVACVTLRFGKNHVYVYIDVSDDIVPYVKITGDELTKFIPLKRVPGNTVSFRMQYGEYRFDETRFICDGDLMSFNPNKEKGYRFEDVTRNGADCKFDVVLDVERFTFLVNSGRIDYVFHNGDCLLD